MKISCSACGKKYDPLKRSGICPYCGMHATEDQIAEAQENDRVQGGNVSEVLRSYLNEKLRKEKKQSPLRRKPVQLTICLLLAGAMAVVAFWGKHIYNERLDYYISQRSTEDLRKESYSLGDTVMLDNCQLRLTGFRVMEEYQSTVSGDFKLLEVSYETKEEGEDISRRIGGAYVLTERGTTVTALDRWSAREALGMTEDEYRDSPYTDGFFSPRGNGDNSFKLIFAVPKKDTSHTVLTFRYNDSFAVDKHAEVRYEFTLREEAAK